MLTLHEAAMFSFETENDPSEAVGMLCIFKLDFVDYNFHAQNQIFIKLVLISFRCNELADSNAAIYADAHSARLRQRRVDENLC